MIFILACYVSEAPLNYFHAYYVSHIFFLPRWHIIFIFPNYVSYNLIWPLPATSTAENDTPAWDDLETQQFGEKPVHEIQRLLWVYIVHVNLFYVT